MTLVIIANCLSKILVMNEVMSQMLSLSTGGKCRKALASTHSGQGLYSWLFNLIVNAPNPRNWQWASANSEKFSSLSPSVVLVHVQIGQPQKLGRVSDFQSKCYGIEPWSRAVTLWKTMSSTPVWDGLLTVACKRWI